MTLIMPKYNVENSCLSVENNYSKATGRVKTVSKAQQSQELRVALLGDSTIDNGFWIDTEVSYSKRVHTVTHQTALALAQSPVASNYVVANFAVDGATTSDVLNGCRLNKVLPYDDDHTNNFVNQIDSSAAWNPDIVVLSVGGNNYREALALHLQRAISKQQLLLRQTPEEAKDNLYKQFNHVKSKLVDEYKQIINDIAKNNTGLRRLVLLSQYYPQLTEFTPYFIYTGFSHLARAERQGRDAFSMTENTMNELYREVLAHAVSLDVELVLVDITSSLNPLGGNHTHQIEPNEEGSKVMGNMIAKAVQYTFPENSPSKAVIIHLDKDETTVHHQIMTKESIDAFFVKPLSTFINESRYRHLNLLFKASSNLNFRFECAYHAIMGKRFDMQYNGHFAFGLLDISLVTVMAAYLWRVAINENVHQSLRLMAGTLAAPILLAQMVTGLALMLALALPIVAYHKAVGLVKENHVVNDANAEDVLAIQAM